MERDKLFFRHVLLYYFDLNKTAAEAHRFISGIVTADCYQQQLYRLNDELMRKRPIIDVK